MNEPLNGITVVDMTHVWAGPLCTQMLADLGAEVIKIEPPEGERSRRIRSPGQREISPVFLGTNRSKKSICIDLRKPEGMEVLKKMLKTADVFVHNYRKRSIERLGLTYSEVSSLNPKIIYAEITGYGERGPLKDLPGQDLQLQAFGGIISITGYPDEERPSAPVGSAIVDSITGVITALGIITALFARNSTGMGQEVKTSLLAGSLYLQGNILVPYLVTGVLLPKGGNGHPYVPPPFGVWRAGDGKEFAISNFDEEAWKRFCSALGKPEWAEDPRFSTMEARTQNRQLLTALILETLKGKTRDEWVDIMRQNGMWATPVQNYAEVAKSEQILANDLLWQVPYPFGGFYTSLGFPLEFGRSALRKPAPPPLPGEHTREVLSRLGYSEAEVSRLISESIAFESESGKGG